MEIEGKVAVVTGGASGIGAGLAERFARDGARGVVVADVNLERAQRVAQGIGAQALALRCDVSREADIQELVRQTRERFGRVDIYFSNAGILGPSPMPARQSRLRCFALRFMIFSDSSNQHVSVGGDLHRLPAHPRAAILFISVMPPAQ